MKRTIAVFVAVVLGLVGSAHALYSVNFRGDWPDSWPKELEPLRKEAHTYVGPELAFQHFAIRFTKRAELETAWPHLMTVKSKGAPIILTRGENFFLGGKVKAGIVVHSPPIGDATPQEPIASENPRTRYMWMTYIEVVTDGDIVDLNRLELPADTPIIDERFK